MSQTYLLMAYYCFISIVSKQKNEQNMQSVHVIAISVFLELGYQFLLPVSVYIKSIKMASDYGDWLHAQKIYSSNPSQMDQRQQLYERGVISILKNESLISLLSTRPPFSRNQKECRAIADLLKCQTYFQNIAKNFKTLLEISSWIEYKRSEPGEYIYKVHDVSDCFYVMIDGEVHLTYPEKEVLEVEEESLKENEANSTRNLKESTFYPTAVPTLAKNLSISPNKPHMEDTKTPKRLTRHQSLFGNDIVQISIPTPKKQLFTERIVQIITNGQSFGDMGDSNRRGTNAIAKQACNLLVIKKQHYSTLSNAHIKSQNKVKYDILSSIPLFKLLYRYALQEIIYLLEQVKVGYNTIIYNENDLIRYTYVIYKGEFKLYKKVRSRKDSARTITQENEEPRCLTKNLSFKTIQIGEILGYTESYRKMSNHLETCVCKSQDGIVLRIDKNKFLKKITSTENNLEEIIPFIEDKAHKKSQEINDFLKKHENDIFIRYMHTPSANARRVNTESTVYKMRSQRKDQLRKMSTASDNFFNQFNKTVKQEVRSTRISIKKCVALKMDQKGEIPSRIKDIIGIVNQQSNYYKIRKPKENITLFEFNISKVPIHVKKKYEILFKKQNK